MVSEDETLKAGKLVEICRSSTLFRERDVVGSNVVGSNNSSLICHGSSIFLVLLLYSKKVEEAFSEACDVVTSLEIRVCFVVE